MITGTQVKEAMIKNRINHVIVRECSICEQPLAYLRQDEILYFDANCGCVSFYRSSEQRSYEDVANLINRQTNQEYKAELMKKFGIQSDTEF